MTIDILPDEVLLEIFNLYRQSFGNQRGFERAWNNKNGWFKLAHVCHNWRSIVLSSPSRLRLRLYFAPNSSTAAATLEYLSHLPIIVDYSKAPWDATIVSNWTSALSHPDRVCSIAIRGSPDNYTHQISEALDVPFPALENVLFQNMGRVDPIYLAPSFITSIQSLQHLRINGGSLQSFLPLSSVSTSLVDLSLSFCTIFA